MSEQQESKLGMGIKIGKLGKVDLTGESQLIKDGSYVLQGPYKLTLNAKSVKDFHLTIERENAKLPNWFPYDTTYVLDQSLMFRGHKNPSGKSYIVQIQFGSQQDLEKWKE